MYEKDNFDEDDIVISKCIGGSDIEEKTDDDKITFTKYIPGSIPKPFTESVKSEDRAGAGSIKSGDGSGYFYY